MNENKSEFEPRIVAFVCNWCTYAGADLTGTSRLKYATNVEIVRFPCTGRIDFMLLLKAFAGGADGIIVSGCHPNDCHYTSGNFHARRRWIVFRGLLDFLGIDVRRICYSWVSAAEGAKWAELVNQTVAAIRELGPYEEYKKVAAYLEQEVAYKLAEKVKSLFTEDLVKLVIGFEKGSHGVHPFFCRNIEEADKLVWDDFCTNNIAVYLTKTELFGTDKTALFANLPALRTILQLASENQLKQEQWIILTLNAQEEVIQFDNFEDIYAYMADYPMLASEEDRQLIEKIQNMTREDRWQYWIHEMSKCIKCYACRAACPLCYCNRCIVEVNCPQWIQAWSAPLTNMEWQVNRVMHMAGRCVECGACAKACPVGIPLHLLTQNMMETIRHEFEKQPGNLGNKGNALATFRVEDKEDFIH